METTNISAKDVMALRQRTGLGMMDCKKALVEASGDMDAAEASLKEKLKGKMDTRTDRATGEGSITIKIQGDKATIIEMRTETDFTARNDTFTEMAGKIADFAIEADAGPVQVDDRMTACIDEVRITTGENMSMARGEVLSGGSFGQYLHHDGKLGVIVQFEGDVDQDVITGICQHIAAHTPTPMAIDESGMPQDLVDARRNEAVQEAKDTGKPDEIAAKIAEGKMRKFFEDNTLLGQKYVRDDKMSVGEILPDGAKILAFKRYQVGHD
ncbi:MAG: translation elongation factor Ts [Phycisphaerae bacterium]|nr:translation elongation factor Ts [Phycisphaerae bacterium]